MPVVSEDGITSRGGSFIRDGTAPSRPLPANQPSPAMHCFKTTNVPRWWRRSGAANKCLVGIGDLAPPFPSVAYTTGVERERRAEIHDQRFKSGVE